MLRGKTGKTFLVQFARPNSAIIFCRTFVELFWSVRVDRKKVTIIVAFHFMKRRLKKRGNGIGTVEFEQKIVRHWPDASSRTGKTNR